MWSGALLKNVWTWSSAVFCIVWSYVQNVSLVNAEIQKFKCAFMRARARVCVVYRQCVCSCVRVCVRACACVRACVCVCSLLAFCVCVRVILWVCVCVRALLCMNMFINVFLCHWFVCVGICVLCIFLSLSVVKRSECLKALFKFPIIIITFVVVCCCCCCCCCEISLSLSVVNMMFCLIHFCSWLFARGLDAKNKVLYLFYYPR